MVDWQITAATLRCDVVGDEVTLLVHKDWSVKCTGAVRYAPGGNGHKKNTRNPLCEGTDCQLAKDYRKKLQDEEADK